MTTIIALRNSPVDLINTALTMRNLDVEDTRKFRLIKSDEIANFWLNLGKERDRNIIVLNLPAPDQKMLSDMPELPDDMAVTYVPSREVAPSRDVTSLLLEKGISVMPPRESYECYPGDRLNPENEEWVSLNKILVLREGKQTALSRSLVGGILASTEQSPSETVWRIVKNDRRYFRQMGKLSGSTTVVLDDDNLSLLKTHAELQSRMKLAFINYLTRRRSPVVVLGKGGSTLFTLTPSHDALVAKRCAMNPERVFKIGRACMLNFEGETVDQVEVLAGKLATRHFLVKFGDPTLAERKTLLRQLFGGETDEKSEMKIYHKHYSGLSEIYPELEKIGQRVIRVPKDAFEEVVEVFNRTGASYEVLD
jgi:hypothetical protein